MKRTTAPIRVETKDLLWGAVGAAVFVGKRRVGEFIAEKRGSDKLVVQRAAMRPGYERRGLGTKGYEALAAWACSNGRTLLSDQNLTDSSRGFWEKQVLKGRAKYLEDDRRFVLTSCAGGLGRVRR